MSEKPAKINLNYQIKIALLAVISFIIMFFEFPIPMSPEFLKVDFSDLPAIVAGFALGPVAGVLVELIKNMLHLFRTSTSGVGELANFMIGGSLVYVASYVYWRKKSFKGAVLGLVLGTIFMAAMGCLMNYFVLLPFYGKFMPLTEIIKLGSKVNPAITDIKTLVLFGIAPFNFVKGLIVGMMTLAIYNKILPLLKGHQ